jgi:ribosomal protein L37AE/L43A
MAPPCKYETDEDRRKAYMEAQRRFAAKVWKCDVCNTSIRRGNKINHLNSKQHKSIVSNLETSQVDK